MSKIKNKLINKICSALLIDWNNTYTATLFLSGMGRSGTTWVGNIINYKNEYRNIFEPFLPIRVPEASPFGYLPYIRPDNHDPNLLNAAKAILSGRIKNAWADQENRKIIASKRLVKDIRTNLMLKWINANFPEIPIILLMRHPCAVANSWISLGWGEEEGGTRKDLDICLSQHLLMQDFLEPFKPIIEKAKDDFDKIILLWCILYYVPLKQFKKGEIHLAFYEELCENSKSEVDRLFSFLEKKWNDTIYWSLHKPSSMATKASRIVIGGSLTDGWRECTSPGQVKRALEILKSFELDDIYSDATMPNVDNAHKKLKSN